MQDGLLAEVGFGGPIKVVQHILMDFSPKKELGLSNKNNRDYGYHNILDRVGGTCMICRKVFCISDMRMVFILAVALT